jgi:hypothetical protein
MGDSTKFECSEFKYQPENFGSPIIIKGKKIKYMYSNKTQL